MFMKIFRGAVVAVTVAITVPYTVAIISNILYGWPKRKDKYKRALHPRKVINLNYVAYQMIRDKPKFLFLFFKWKSFYRNANPQYFLKNIPYGRNDCLLDLHLRMPKSSPPDSDKAPVIIFVYGGSWSSGNKAMYGLLAHEIVSRSDCLVVCPSYSTYPKGYVDDMVQDIADCLTWVVDNIERYGGDPNQVILMGHSAGAQLCALTIIELLRHERVSVDSSFKFDPVGASITSTGGGDDGLDELAFADSHYGRMSSALYRKREGLGDSSGSSESFAVVSENGSNGDNNGSNGDNSGSNGDGLDVNSASFLDSSVTSEGYVKAGLGESMEESEIVEVEHDLGSGDGVHKDEISPPSEKSSQQPTAASTAPSDKPALSSSAAKPSGGKDGSSKTSGGGTAEGDEEEDESGDDNDSIITVRQKDLDRNLSVSDLSRSVKAFIGFAGVYSIADHYKHESWRGVEDVSCMGRAFYGEDHFDRFSPLEIVRRLGQPLSLPPMVLVHGDQDYIVPTSSSSNFAQALASIEADVKLQLIPDCPHYEVCLDMMDPNRKFYSHGMNIVLETIQAIS